MFRLEDSELDPAGDILNTAWGRGVCGIKGLRWFDLVFRTGDSPDHPHLGRKLVQRPRALLIGAQNETGTIGQLNLPSFRHTYPLITKKTAGFRLQVVVVYKLRLFIRPFFFFNAGAFT